MWRKLLRGIGCAGYLALLGVLFVVIAYVAFSVFVRGGVTATPELVGLSRADAAGVLADHGLEVRWSDSERFDPQIARGHVMAQDPRAGVYIKRQAQVTLMLSRGPQQIAVPQLDGRALQTAQVDLAGAGLTLGRTFEIYDPTEGSEPGTVVRQRPAAGTLVAVDAPVDLFLSIGSPEAVYVMPDLVRHPADRVRSFFEARGFRIGRVGYESYDGAEPGTVLRQFPVAGHPLRQGEVISLDVVAPLERRERDLAGPSDTGFEEQEATR